MQSVKYFLRTIGMPNIEQSVISSQAAEDELNYNYLSQGYTIESTHYLGGLKTQEGNEIGYRVFHVLVKNEEPKKVTVKEPK